MGRNPASVRFTPGADALNQHDERMPVGLFNRKKKSDSDGEDDKNVPDQPTEESSSAEATGDAAPEEAGDGKDEKKDKKKLTKEEKAAAKEAAKQAKADAKAAGKDKKDKKEKKPKVIRDPRKARRFFEHAETVAEARQYDYAIQLYISGFRHDPDNMPKHEALREIALRRKVSGGKPAKFRESLGFGAKDKVDKMLHAEMLWSKDPLNLQRMMDTMERAVDADDAEDELMLGEVAFWVGNMILEKNETDKPPKKADILKVRDLFERIGAWEEAGNATRKAMEIDPDDTDLPEQLKEIEAEVAMAKGNYDGAAVESQRDAESQAQREAESQLSKTDQAAEQLIAKARADVEENPEDVDLRIKLIRALAERNNEEAENEAIALLEKTFEETGQHRHKTMIGDIRIKQMNRQLRDLKGAAKADPKNAEIVEAYKKLTRKKLEFELREYADRVNAYPTDMKWRYELGKRLMMVKRYDDAMANFQQAKNDPKYRANASSYLGQCYIKQKWYDEAIETLRDALEQMPDASNQVGMEIQWYLMTALASSGIENKNVDTLKDSLKVASRILQTDINYRDIKTRIEQIRSAIKKLQAKDAK